MDVLWGMAAALAAGILQNSALFAAAFLLLVCLAYAARMRRRDGVLLSLLLSLLYFYGYQSLDRYRDGIAVLGRVAASSKSPLLIEGWVASYPQQAYGETRFEFVSTIDGTTHRLRVHAHHFLVGYGDSLQMQVTFAGSKRSTPVHLLSRGVSGSARALDGSLTHVEGGGGGILKREVLWPLHERLRRETVSGIGARAGVPLALLLGERGLLDRKVREAFATLGISHLLALSGLHLGFVALVLIKLTAGIRRRRGSVVLAALVFYVSVVGFILSLYRALVMAGLLIVARGVHRPLRPLDALGNAFVLMLLCHPYALFSVAFQLSFLATFAVLLAVSRLDPPPKRGYRRKAWYWFRSTVQVSVAAQVVLAPVLLLYFERVSVVAPLATALLVFPVVLVLIATVIAATASTVFSSLGHVLFDVLQRMTKVFDHIVLFCAELAPEPLELSSPSLPLYYIGLGALWFSRGRPSLRLAGLLTLLAAWMPFFPFAIF